MGKKRRDGYSSHLGEMGLDPDQTPPNSTILALPRTSLKAGKMTDAPPKGFVLKRLFSKKKLDPTQSSLETSSRRQTSPDQSSSDPVNFELSDKRAEQRASYSSDSSDRSSSSFSSSEDNETKQYGGGQLRAIILNDAHSPQMNERKSSSQQLPDFVLPPSPFHPPETTAKPEQMKRKISALKALGEMHQRAQSHGSHIIGAAEGVGGSHISEPSQNPNDTAIFSQIHTNHDLGYPERDLSADGQKRENLEESSSVDLFYNSKKHSAFGKTNNENDVGLSEVAMRAANTAAELVGLGGCVPDVLQCDPLKGFTGTPENEEEERERLLALARESLPPHRGGTDAVSTLSNNEDSRAIQQIQIEGAPRPEPKSQEIRSSWPPPDSNWATFDDEGTQVTSSSTTHDGLSGRVPSPLPTNGATSLSDKDESKIHPPQLSPEEERRRFAERLTKARNALSRPFGRKSLPPSLARRWIVEVSMPIWDNDIGHWMYRVAVTYEKHSDAVAPSLPTDSPIERPSDILSSSSAFIEANTIRSLQDFVWLEQALRAEFHGGLMLPLLSLAIHSGTSVVDLGGPTIASDGSLSRADETSSIGLNSRVIDPVSAAAAALEVKMDEKDEVRCCLLGDWLSDVLNGVRGQGELLLGAGLGHVVRSKAMEAFLFRNTEPLPNPTRRGRMNGESCNTAIESCIGLTLNDPFGNGLSGSLSGNQEALSALMFKPFRCFGPEKDSSLEHQQKDANQLSSVSSPPLQMISCSSHAAGDPLWNAHDHDDGSLTTNGGSHHHFSNLAIHSELLEAQHEWVVSYQCAVTRAINRLRVLMEEENVIASSWKRFAISLSNLFSFEKDVEAAKVGENSVSRNSYRRIPFKKLTKSIVDDSLRILARQKVDRSTPSLKMLGGMLGAFLTDLASVEPNLRAYGEAVTRIQLLDDSSTAPHEANGQGPLSTLGNRGWQNTLKVLGSIKISSALSRHNPPENLLNTVTAVGSSQGENGDDWAADIPPPQMQHQSQRKTFELRLISNERFLKESLTALCCVTPLRSARIAWKYFKMEAGQAALLNSAAAALRNRLTFDEYTDALLDQSRRHDQEKKEDDKKELELIRRIFNLGGSQKLQLPDNDTWAGFDSNGNSTDGGSDEEEERRREAKRKRLFAKALRLASERLGRWDTKLSLAIMEAAGVEDAHVRVEETTRDLRSLRKYAIGLRENLDRCVEAVEVLNDSLMGSDTEKSVDGSSIDRKQRRKSKINNRSTRTEALKITRSREGLLSAVASVFGGPLAMRTLDSARHKPGVASSTARVLQGAGIDTTDRAGWLDAVHILESQSKFVRDHRIYSDPNGGNCGIVAISYQKARDKDIPALLSKISQMLEDYEQRVEEIESFVYMHCVGVQLEKHFSKHRANALAAWEKKTDITAAINIATKKRLPHLVDELKTKLRSLPTDISHTGVKQAKEKHLASKMLKTDLQNLANGRFQRAKETATERVISIMRLWVQHEESVAKEEIKSLGEALREVERNTTEVDIETDGGAHLFDSGPGITLHSILDSGGNLDATEA